MKFSIIVPVYNSEKYLEKCMTSLLNQDIEEYEVILINDCSKDNSSVIIEEKYSDNNRIKVINNEKNLGLSDTRNNGMKVAQGKYLIFVDSDDYIEENSLNDLWNQLEKSDWPDVLYFGFLEEYGENTEAKFGYKCDKDKLYSAKEFIKMELRKRNLYAPACFAVYKRETLRKNSIFFGSGLLHEDELWTPSVLLISNNVYTYPKYLYHYVRHENSITIRKDTTKNGLDLKRIAEIIDEKVMNLEDDEERRLFKEHAARLYMRGVSVGKLFRKEYRATVDKSFPMKRTINMYDKFKSILFYINLRLYYIINKLIVR